MSKVCPASRAAAKARVRASDVDLLGVRSTLHLGCAIVAENAPLLPAWQDGRLLCRNPPTLCVRSENTKRHPPQQRGEAGQVTKLGCVDRAIDGDGERSAQFVLISPLEFKKSPKSLPEQRPLAFFGQPPASQLFVRLAWFLEALIEGDTFSTRPNSRLVFGLLPKEGEQTLLTRKACTRERRVRWDCTAHIAPRGRRRLRALILRGDSLWVASTHLCSIASQDHLLGCAPGNASARRGNKAGGWEGGRGRAFFFSPRGYRDAARGSDEKLCASPWRGTRHIGREECAPRVAEERGARRRCSVD